MLQPRVSRLIAFLVLLCFPVVAAQPTLPPTTLPPSIEVVPVLPTGQPTSPPTIFPSPSPSMIPTVSLVPSSAPSTPPSLTPTITLAPSSVPSDIPSLAPTETIRPSHSPSVSLFPSVSPTRSPAPSASPSTTPSISAIPSVNPSSMPTAAPTFEKVIRVVAFFNHKFIIGDLRAFNQSEIDLFQGVMQDYTFELVPDITLDDRINTTCIIRSQSIGEVSDIDSNLVNYQINYVSKHTNVSNFAFLFQEKINGDLDDLTNRLQIAGLDVFESQAATALTTTLSPTSVPSLFPSEAPSNTESTAPTLLPSLNPSIYPTMVPTADVSNFPTLNAPSYPPSDTPTEIATSRPSLDDGEGGSNATAIVVPVVLICALISIFLFLAYRRRKHQKEMAYQTMGTERNINPSWNSQAETLRISTNATSYSNQQLSHASNMYSRGSPPPMDTQVVGMLSPAESLVSNQSLLSVGNSMGGESVNEADDTYHLADEFDQYKDQNLEKMRAGVESNLPDFDGMMSHALTKALMEDDDSPDPKDLLWGGSGGAMEIEASALGEVNDWLKRNDEASVDDKRTFMQETLNRMVASVRHGVIGPEQASRAIHECGALLGLQLAENFPTDTLIVTGMRKTVKKEDVREAFHEFGEIEDAGVSAFERGFGLVRFKSPKSVLRAMEKFRTEEIVVQDVAVMVKVLKADHDRHTPPLPAPDNDMHRHISAPLAGNREAKTSSGPHDKHDSE